MPTVATAKWWMAGRVSERASRSLALWAVIVASLALASCGGGGSSPEEVRSCLNDAGLEADPLPVGETEREDYEVQDEIRVNLGQDRGATVYFFDSEGDASSFTDLPTPGGISEQYGEMSFFVGPGIPEEDLDAIRGCLKDGG